MVVLIFYISLAIASLMLAVKIYEARRRKRSVVYKVFSYFDEWTHFAVSKVLGAVRRILSSAYNFLVHELPKRVYDFLVRCIAYVRSLYDRSMIFARGVQRLKSNPKVSSFLRDIEQAKKEIRANKDSKPKGEPREEEGE